MRFVLWSSEPILDSYISLQLDKSFADLNYMPGSWYQVVDTSQSVCAEDSLDSVCTVKLEKSDSDVTVLDVIEDPFEVNIHAVVTFVYC